jgi:hypothetical protein
LNVDAASTYLSNTSNQISQISGRTAIGTIDVYSVRALTVGTVDGMAGIAGYGSVTLTSGGVLTATAAEYHQPHWHASSLERRWHEA